MRFLAVVLVATACTRPRAPAAPILPTDGDLAAREAAYDRYRLTADDDRVMRADGTHHRAMFVQLFDASPRSHALIHRYDKRKLAAAILSTIGAIACVVAVGTLDENGYGNRATAPLLLGSAALNLTASGLIIASPFPSTSELTNAYNADLRDQLGLR